MITALLVLVCTVVLVGWLMAAFAFVATIAAMISRAHERSSSVPGDSASFDGRWRAADAQFLRDVGIRR